MSRITRGRVDVGETADASTLNGTYADFNQPAALNAYNTRDQAFDLPHINAPIVLNRGTAALGNTGMLHAAPFSTAASTTNSAAPVVTAVANSAGSQTFLNVSSSPWSMVSGDVLRVWWNLSVFPSHAALTPWTAAGALGKFNVPGGGGANLPDSLHMWIIFLQWDITNASLLNWTEVPGQSGFSATVGAYKGANVADMAASSVVSPWSVFNPRTADNGSVLGSSTAHYDQNWFSNYGMWAYPATGSVTVYGLRLVIAGVFHPVHQTAAPSENAVVYDVSVGDPSVVLNYKGGRLNALHMRGS